MDYLEEYDNINFRVNYTYDPNRPESIVFAAQPHELLEEDERENEPSRFLLYGRADFTMTMEVGFRGYRFIMTDDLHSRIGELYKMVRAEYFMRYKAL